jgi:hypothetical protein
LFQKTQQKVNLINQCVQLLSSNRAIALQMQGECGVTFNHSIIQSINQSINQTIKQSNNQSEKQID